MRLMPAGHRHRYHDRWSQDLVLLDAPQQPLISVRDVTSSNDVLAYVTVHMPWLRRPEVRLISPTWFRVYHDLCTGLDALHESVDAHMDRS